MHAPKIKFRPCTRTNIQLKYIHTVYTYVQSVLESHWSEAKCVVGVEHQIHVMAGWKTKAFVHAYSPCTPASPARKHEKINNKLHVLQKRINKS